MCRHQLAPALELPLGGNEIGARLLDIRKRGADVRRLELEERRSLPHMVSRACIDSDDAARDRREDVRDVQISERDSPRQVEVRPEHRDPNTLDLDMLCVELPPG